MERFFLTRKSLLSETLLVATARQEMSKSPQGQTKSNLCCLVPYANYNPSLLHNVGDV